jgi:hypothetical protein
VFSCPSYVELTCSAALTVGELALMCCRQVSGPEALAILTVDTIHVKIDKPMQQSRCTRLNRAGDKLEARALKPIMFWGCAGRSFADRPILAFSSTDAFAVCTVHKAIHQRKRADALDTRSGVSSAGLPLRRVASLRTGHGIREMHELRDVRAGNSSGWRQATRISSQADQHGL